MSKKEDIIDTMLLSDERLQSDMQNAIKDLMQRHSDVIRRRLLVGNILRGENEKLILDLIKITEEISEKYLLNNLQEIDELLKIDPRKFNKYMEIGEGVGLAYCIRFHLQKRKRYESFASKKALQGVQWAFEYCTGFYNKRGQKLLNKKEKEVKSDREPPPFESARKR